MVIGYARVSTREQSAEARSEPIDGTESGLTPDSDVHDPHQIS